METYPDLSGQGVAQSEGSISGEAGLVDTLGNNDPNANRGMEPNFNLNLYLTSPSKPHPSTETRRLHGEVKTDNGNKGRGRPGVKVAVTMETGKWASSVKTLMSTRENGDLSRQKSKIPAFSRSPTAERSVNSGDEQMLKSPKPKHTPTLSPKTHTQSNTAVSLKTNRLEQTTTSSPRTAERVKPQMLRAESSIILNSKSHSAHTNEMTTPTNKITTNLKMQSNRKQDGGQEVSPESESPQSHLPVNPKVQIQKGDVNVISPKLASQTPTLAVKTQKSHPANVTIKSNEQASHDPRPQSYETSSTGPKSENQRAQRAETAMLSAKTQQQSSLSPKPATQRKVTGSASKGNLVGKDSSLGSGSKTNSKSSSNSKATTVKKDSLDSQPEADSKARSSSKTTMGSRDSLDSKSGSASKTSLGSKDSLDSKTGSNSKASSDSKHGMGSRDSIDSKTAADSKADKTDLDFKTVVVSKSSMGSKVDIDHKNPLANPKTSSSIKPGSNLSSSCDILSSSKSGPTWSTSKPALIGSSSNMDHVGSSSISGLSGCNDSILKSAGSSAKPSPDPRAEPDSCKTGPVQSISTSALADLCSSLAPRPSSTSRSPGLALGRSSAGPSREGLRSPGSAPGSSVISRTLAPLAPLATSSPKITTTLTKKRGCTPEPVETSSSNVSQHIGLTRGLTFDSITKTQAAIEEEHLKLPENKGTAVGGLEVSQGAMQGVCVSERADRSPGDTRRVKGMLLSKLGHHGDGNAITTGRNILLPKPIGVESKKEEKKNQDKGKQGDGRACPALPLRPLSHSANTKRVREAATMTDPDERLHLHREEQREVGVQVEVQVVERSASTSPSLHLEAPTSSMIGSPSYQSGGLTSPAVPSMCCISAGQRPFQHVCTIDIELCSQSVLPSVVADKASSLPACLRAYSFQQSPGLLSELGAGQDQNRDISTESIWEEGQDKRDYKGVREQNKKGETVKPQEVAWDEQGMTWEVYGATVDLESLGTAIQSHLQSKIREQEKHISTLRKSICSDSSLKAYKIKKRRKRRGGILGCCRKAPSVAD